ncbi:MAG: SUMF1/EgtB/PvdO family nonheme iron enzyme [Gammaproteobacteria bacterium]|nr:SUMF1/EgtB/PvdO family nonheme iron enzyme [Gammaproteobacteria bacterium]MDH4314368.1 SUMF1/EgtB/PvdO family nonheme iron enzyme [Gammaproteobacteria bacterium]MDH5214206.1 SUMF1/EgtB/PvdO family nonheme iron enzyme [Gammaproteobacteria bacterium]MDH5499508.1 SUMF1/EgtB/PvdO family nonheme iron enzyme [Gammaproteobacteria bacterium]
MDKPFPAYDGDGPYVFVCYAHDDSRIVYPEILWLRDQGINIWYDEGISPGAEFPEKLGKAILGASLVLFYVSPTSVNSRHCRDEVYFGIDKNIPVLASHIAATEMPPGLAMSTGTTQALMRYEIRQKNYRRKLLAGVKLLSESPDYFDLASISAEAPTLLSALSRYAIPVSLLALVSVASFAVFEFKRYLDHEADVRWAKDELLPEIRSQLEVNWGDFTETYDLALQAEEIIPDDPGLADIFETISMRIDIDSDPPGADVFMKDYRSPEEQWRRLGVTPVTSIRVPVGVFRWKFVKEGYETVTAAASSWDISLSGKMTNKELLHPNNIFRKLDRIGELPPGTVRVAGTATPQGEVRDFFIDRYEVTNGKFQKFVQAGAYRNKDYWRHDFVEDGEVISWEEGISRFVDSTGRPGPSSWLGGTYPDGTENYPVSGVSWYEAAAYAEYAGKSLPTGMHWGVARGEYSPLIQFPQLGGFALFAPFSNFRGKGTVEVGSLPGVTAYGTYDLAGNVREWCSNDTAMGKLVRGGSFSDNPYRFSELSQAPPMFRGPDYGFRTVVYPGGLNVPEAAFTAVPINPATDWYDHEVVSDEIFEVFLRQYDFDDLDLNVRQESLDNSSELWTVERVSVDTPYGDERMIINLFLPKTSEPPFQTVIYFPGSASLFKESSKDIDQYYEYPVFLSFLVKTGRAVAYPVYKGTFERRDDRLLAIHMGTNTYQYSEFLTQLVKDFRRTIDYLETRPDIDGERLAFYGMSWGAVMGAIIPAVETRPKTAIILAGGIYEAGLPEVSPINYAPRITMPFLMMVGRYDSIVDQEASAKPLFDLIGTPEEHKVLKIYETDHIPPKSEYISEMLAWLDLYLGPVDKAAATPATVSPGAY